MGPNESIQTELTMLQAIEFNELLEKYSGHFNNSQL